MNMRRSGQICGIEKGNGMKQATFIASPFGVTLEAEQEKEKFALPACFSYFLQHNRFRLAAKTLGEDCESGKVHRERIVIVSKHTSE